MTLNIKANDLYWLAGLLEGEGSFLKPPPSDPNRPRINVEMTDEDVIQRVNQFFGLNYYLKRFDPRSEFHKSSYRVTARGMKAVGVMRLLYPLMGERRKKQIEIAIGEKPDIQFFSTDENQFFWLVGLLEGEGSFQKSVPSKQKLPCVQLHMTDQDIVKRAASLMGTRLYGPYHSSGDTNKPSYYTTLQGKRAVDLMKQMQPHLGLRRQAQIDAVIASYHPVGHVRGDTHPQAKLNAEKVHNIKQRLAQGEQLKKLASEFGVDKGLIWQIKAGRIWQQVD